MDEMALVMYNKNTFYKNTMPQESRAFNKASRKFNRKFRSLFIISSDSLSIYNAPPAETKAGKENFRINSICRV